MSDVLLTFLYLFWFVVAPTQTLVFVFIFAITENINCEDQGYAQLVLFTFHYLPKQPRVKNNRYAAKRVQIFTI